MSILDSIDRAQHATDVALALVRDLRADAVRRLDERLAIIAEADRQRTPIHDQLVAEYAMIGHLEWLAPTEEQR